MIERLAKEFCEVAARLLGASAFDVPVDVSLSILAKGDDHSSIYQLLIEIESMHPDVKIDLSDEPFWPSIWRLAEITAHQMRVSA